MNILNDIVDDLFGSKSEKHLTISSKDLWAGNPNFQNSKHSARHLVDTICEYAALRGNRLSPLQKFSLRKVETEKMYREPMQGVSNDDIVRAYFCRFDDIFFFGSLKAHCHIHFSDILASSIDINGATQETHSSGQSRKMNIVLYSRRDRKYHRDKLLQVKFGTLLHEMLHCFFKLWSCRDKDHFYKHETEGVTGHGYAWQKAAQAIEVAVRDPKLLGLRCDLKRELSWASELRVAGRKCDKKAVELARKWGMSGSEVEHQYKVSRWREGKAPT